MANELSLSVRMRLAKGGLKKSFSSGSLSIDVAGTNVIDNVQNIGTSEEAVLLGEASTGGYVIAHNLDATNYVSLRAATGTGNFLRINAGEIAVFRLEAAAPFAIANTAACNVRFIVIPV
jgi:hypothetical protein